MKNRKRIVAVVVALLAALAVWLHQSSSINLRGETVESVAGSSDEKFRSSEPSTKSGVGVEGAVAGTIGRVARRVANLASMVSSMNRPVEFHLKVVDQTGAPIAGVYVHGYVSEIRGAVVADTRNHWVEGYTDGNGAFVIEGDGHYFGTEVLRKPGYVFESSGHSSFANYRGHTQNKGPPQTSREQPWIFRGWKKVSRTALVQNKLTGSGPQDQEFWFPQDGSPQPLPFKQFKTLLSVSIETDPAGTRADPKDWTFRIRSACGIVEIGTRLPYEAPDAGYAPEWSRSYRDEAQGYVDEDSAKLFFCGLDENGRTLYGRINLQFKPFSSPPYSNADRHRQGRVIFTYWINPEGGRDLSPSEEEVQYGVITNEPRE